VSLLGTIPTGTGNGWCSAVVTISGVYSTWGGTTGAITIANTGSLSSTFAMSMPAAPSGLLCADLTLKVTDLATTAPDGGTRYAAAALSTTMGTTHLYNDAPTPNLTWTGGGAPATGTGATGNTFTLTVGTGSSFSTRSSDAGQSCTFSVLFTQAA
jgi:hypothetical protein